MNKILYSVFYFYLFIYSFIYFYLNFLFGLASYLLTQWQFWQLTLKWLSGARPKDKTKQYYCCFLFFLFLIRLCDSRKIHYLTREFHLHLTTDIARSKANRSEAIRAISVFKRTLLESGLGLLVKQYEKNPSYGHTHIHVCTIKWCLGLYEH